MTSQALAVNQHTGEVEDWTNRATVAPVSIPVGLTPTDGQAGKFGAGWKGPKGAPVQSKTLVATHPDRVVIEGVAAILGGDVVEVIDKMMKPEKQYRVVTKASSLDVMIKSTGSYSAVYESWSAGGVSMRTDGVRNLVSGSLLADPCPPAAAFDTPQEATASAKAWADRNDLTLTTRLKVVPMDLPSLTPWKVETHSWMAASTFANTALNLAVFANNGVGCVAARVTLTPATGNDVLEGRRAPASAREAKPGQRQMTDGTWVGKSNFVLWNIELVTQTPKTMMALSQVATMRAVEVARAEVTQMLELERSTDMSKRAVHGPRTFDRADPFPLDEQEVPAGSPTVIDAKNDLVAAIAAAGVPEAERKALATKLWGARVQGKPTFLRRDTYRLLLGDVGDIAEAILAAKAAQEAAVTPPAGDDWDDDIIDAEVVENNTSGVAA